jgi:hydrogenase-4 component B
MFNARPRLRAAGARPTILLAASLASFLIAAVAAPLLGKAKRAAGALGAAAAGGSALALAAGGSYFAGFDLEPLRAGGAFGTPSLDFALDALSAFFLVPLGLVGVAAATFGPAYLARHAPGRTLGSSWFPFNALMAAMVAVLTARNGLAFLIAWESVALVSFLLVIFDGDRPQVRAAAWLYLVASQLGAAFLVAFFTAAAAAQGTVDFAALSAASPPDPARALALFALALVGFGMKAGLVPFHVWLPEAHPAAPAHGSALMSGAMVNLGVYGLMRALTFLGPPALAWGWALVAVGGASGAVGALYAFAQRDLKRALAYSTVDNMGIAAIGLGVGVLGTAAGAPTVAMLGYAGTLVHVLAHSLAKAQLFLAAGALSTATHTVDLDALGGALRRMPRTGAATFVGAASLAGVPPFGGFVGEFLILAGAVAGAASLPSSYAIPAAVAAGAAALTGALAAAVFVRAFGAAFLGRPRSPSAEGAREVPASMAVPMLGLCATAAGLGLLAPLVLTLAVPAASMLARPAPSADGAIAAVQGSVEGIVQALTALLLLAAGLGGLRRIFESRAPRATGPTWDCGYAAPTPRMQYTASSFSVPASRFLHRLAPRRIVTPSFAGLFPRPSALTDEAPDAMLQRGYEVVGAGMRRALGGVLRLQNGRIQAYVLYVVAALVAVLFWGLL